MVRLPPYTYKMGKLAPMDVKGKGTKLKEAEKVPIKPGQLYAHTMRADRKMDRRQAMAVCGRIFAKIREKGGRPTFAGVRADLVEVQFQGGRGSFLEAGELEEMGLTPVVVTFAAVMGFISLLIKLVVPLIVAVILIAFAWGAIKAVPAMAQVVGKGLPILVGAGLVIVGGVIIYRLIKPKPAPPAVAPPPTPVAPRPT